MRRDGVQLCDYARSGRLHPQEYAPAKTQKHVLGSRPTDELSISSLLTSGEPVHGKLDRGASEIGPAHQGNRGRQRHPLDNADARELQATTEANIAGLKARLAELDSRLGTND